jgi:hypothetical protein
MCPSMATCLSDSCCFSELAPLKSNSACWSSTKQTLSSFHWKLTCHHFIDKYQFHSLWFHLIDHYTTDAVAIVKITLSVFLMLCCFYCRLLMFSNNMSTGLNTNWMNNQLANTGSCGPLVKLVCRIQLLWNEKYLGRTEGRTEVKQYTPLPLRGARV